MNVQFSKSNKPHMQYMCRSFEFGCTILQTLCLSAAVLFYVMTRDKLNTEWDDNGAGIKKWGSIKTL